ncbi:hypothetical protein BH09VER1_BH09VER1_28860 [soil metagenome]
MSRYIFKVDDTYFEWSTVVDAPVTRGMTLTQLEAYVLEEEGKRGLAGLPERLERVERNGTSALIPTTLEDLLALWDYGGHKLTKEAALCILRDPNHHYWQPATLDLVEAIEEEYKDSASAGPANP